jgi:hypothetical protein
MHHWWQIICSKQGALKDPVVKLKSALNAAGPIQQIDRKRGQKTKTKGRHE